MYLSMTIYPHGENTQHVRHVLMHHIGTTLPGKLMGMEQLVSA